jgi:hypothetical protein
MAASICLDAQPHETKYGTLYFPEPPEEYLEIRYGPDWHLDRPDGKAIFHEV